MLAIASASILHLAGIDVGAGDTIYVAGTGGAVARQMRATGVPAFALDEDPEELAAASRPLSAGSVLGAPGMSRRVATAGCASVLPFKPGPSLVHAAAALGLDVLAAEPRLARALENKLQLPGIAAAAGVGTPATLVAPLDGNLAGKLPEAGLRWPVVLQPATGFAGIGTVLLRDAGELAAEVRSAPRAGVPVKLAEFVEGEPLTVNGVVLSAGHDTSTRSGAGTPARVLVGMVARQLTGIPDLTPSPFGSCGNDWTLPPPAEVVAAVRDMAARVGAVLSDRGFRGCFGIDAVAPTDGRPPALIEVNPRMTASFALQVQLQAVQGLPTLAAAHLHAWGHGAWAGDLDDAYQAYGPGHDAACTQSVPPMSTILVYNAAAVPVDAAPVEPGVWASGDGQLRRLRDGWRLVDLAAPDEMLLLPQGGGAAIAPGSIMARVVLSRGAALDGAARSLDAHATALTDQVVALVNGGRS